MKIRLQTLALACAAIFSSCEKPVSPPSVPPVKEEPTDTVETPDPLPETVKILAIGNSFSADAVEQELYPIFESAGQKVIIGDMYIGGSPLSTHSSNVASDAAAYSYRKIVDGVLTTTSSVKLSTAFADEDWTFISVQEGAGWHGYYNDSYQNFMHSMEPDLTAVINAVKKACPKAKIIYHAPWVAKADYTGTKFSYYNFDKAKMYEMITKASKEVLAAHPEINLYINTVDAVENLRTSYIGDNVHRDGWHLNYTVGRFTAGCIWYEKITGKSVLDVAYRPETISEATATVCRTAAHLACEKVGEISDLSYFKKPDSENVDDVQKKVLAKWLFTPTVSVECGNCMNWTGQNSLGVYRYSNEPGERGYMMANGSGNSGKLSYVQIDKTQYAANTAGLSCLNAGTGGQPVACGFMPGDYWQFETLGGNQFAEGTRLHMIFTYNPGNYGAKYWRLEYKDGDKFVPVPAFELKTETIPTTGETIDYNLSYGTAQRIVEFIVTLENPTDEFVVRHVCCSSYQVNGVWKQVPNALSVSRIAGVPDNDAKPTPVMSQIL